MSGVSRFLDNLDTHRATSAFTISLIISLLLVKAKFGSYCRIALTFGTMLALLWPAVRKPANWHTSVPTHAFVVGGDESLSFRAISVTLLALTGWPPDFQLPRMIAIDKAQIHQTDS
jgi:hypothetical protein